MLNCQKCGYDNELGRIFCHSCGTKLDLSQIKGPGQGGPSSRTKQKRAAGSGWRTFRLCLELVVLLGILAAFFLMAQMPEQPPAKPTATEVSAAEAKRFALDRLITRQRAGKVTLTEKDINAHLSSIQMEKAPDTWLVFAPSQVAVQLLDGEVKAKMWGELRLAGSFSRVIYLTYTCVPELTDEGLTIRTAGASIGKLPLHPKLVTAVPLVQKFMAAVFGRLSREAGLLSKLNSIEVQGEEAILEYQPTK